MKDVLNNVKTGFACWGTHVGLTILLAVSLAAYDGLENTYPIVIGYMFLGWIIPFAFWRFFKKGLNQSVNSVRSNIDTYVAPVLFMAFGMLFSGLGVFVGDNLTNKIIVNGETITKSDPRFHEMNLKLRISMTCIGLLFIVVGYFLFRFIQKRKKSQSL